ncbi:putative hemolysin [Candidatus Nanopelagicus hibericus]|uniref:Putative hemolysin n=1 Tax=Candidatus Nanopelagicus hibericus TaxID=1884915 RepID=A0A249KAT3_9ACTN|nr:hemolysin family protein [Candidatus Nanopelagicus hibericus]ASY13901.1 putative hemolysin [Candidatus Nanopelagicus hibericus]
MADGALISIAIVLGLIALGGIFVAAEIALISLRESQVKQLASKGKRGVRVAKLTSNPNRFLAAVQVGITLCGFLSAAFGADQLGTYVIPALERAGFSEQASEILSIVGITLVIVYISLVFGELVPKRLALFKTEKIALATAAIIDRVAIIFKPVIWLLSHSTDLIVRIFGITAQTQRSKISDVELMELVSGHTDLSTEEREIVEEVFNTSDRLIHEVMVPRTEVDFLDASLSISEARKVAAELAHSRYPVVRGSSDEIIGFLHVRDLLNPKLDDAQITIMEIIRNVIFLPGTKGVLPALTEMRSKRQHIAIVLDEYGGTDGIITLENLVECLIGEIHDEYDGHEGEPKPEQRTGDIEIDGLISLEDLQDLAGITLPEGPYETVSGFIMNYLGRIAQVGDVVRINGARFTITSMTGKRAGQILLSKEVRK